MILVTGREYSGTSLVAGVLHHLGVDMGNIETPAQLAQQQAHWGAYFPGGTPRGYLSYECQTFLAQVLPLFPLATYANRFHAEGLLTLLTTYAQTRSGQWGMKSPLLLFLAFTAQLEALPAQWVLTVRDVEAVCASGRKYLGAESPYALFAADMRGRLDLAYRLCCERLRQQAIWVDFETLRDCPEVGVPSLSAQLGLTPTCSQFQAAQAFVQKGD